MTHLPALVTDSQWSGLKRFTDARIALGRAGHSLPTSAHLNFQLAHAQARDAVHLPFDSAGVAHAVEMMGLPSLVLNSAASDRNTYLQRPDLGRRLCSQSLERLRCCADGHADQSGFDLGFVITDGLSALAIHQNAVLLLTATAARLKADDTYQWSMAPIVLVEQGRVAIGDEVGQVIGARIVVVLIGERPGLSSPDSMGVYITSGPKVGLHDAKRNCISNVRPAGLPVEAAAEKLQYLLTQARSLGLTGIELKDESGSTNAIEQNNSARIGNASIWKS
jgi:ethanolamine ammonia-lyase small subunit